MSLKVCAITLSSFGIVGGFMHTFWPKAKKKSKSRYLHFSKRAKFVKNGQLFMTPTDFLTDITSEITVLGKEKENLCDKTLNEMKKIVPKLSEETLEFKKIGDLGIISYSEYLFLLSILNDSNSIVTKRYV